MPILNMIAQGSGGGGSNVGEPTNLSAVATSASSIDITWTDNNLQAIPPSTFQKSVLVRKVGSAPTTPSDGTTVVTETVMNTYQSSAYTDTGLTEGTTYYYQVFSYSTDGGITYGIPVSATPSGGWQPGANTLFYFPLKEDILDYSGNNISASGGGTITYQGGAGALISSVITINYNTQPTDFTASCYIKTVTISDIATAFGNLQLSGGYKGWDMATNIYNAGQPNSLRIECLGASPTRKQAFTPTLGDTTTRHLVTFVKDGTNSMGYFYIDGSLVGSESLVGTASTGNYIISDGTMYMGDVILEDKCWTAQEISDYFDQTKGDYGIS